MKGIVQLSNCLRKILGVMLPNPSKVNNQKPTSFQFQKVGKYCESLLENMTNLFEALVCKPTASPLRRELRDRITC